MTPRELANEHSRKHNARTTDGDSDVPKKIRELQERIKRLEQAGDAVAAIIGPPGSAHWADEDKVDAAWTNWTEAKESK